MPSDERDRQFERALQRHLRGNSPDAACPDAETLAAYHERTLSLEELARWKEHIQGCVRCQETLALVEETNSVAMPEEKEITRLKEFQNFGSTADTTRVLGKMFGETVEELAGGGPEMMVGAARRAQTQAVRRLVGRSTWKWIAPVGALAAGLLIFVVIRESKMPMAPSQPVIQVAENRETAAAMAKQAEAPQQQKLEEAAAPKSENKSSGQRVDKGQRAAASPALSNQPTGEDYSFATGKNERDKLKKDEGAAFQRMEVKPNATEERRLQEQTRADLDAARAKSVPAASAPMASPAPTAPTKAVGEVVAGGAGEAKKESRVQADKTKAAGASTETVPAPTEEYGYRATLSSENGRLLRDNAAKDDHFVLAPQGMYGWHLGAAGAIQATSDGGKTWKKQVSGVTSDLSSGSAPEVNVCWIVGNAGTVLLTTDGGKHWTRISSPVQEDLGGVHAADAQHAIIWDVPNRKSFQTADGGVTWTPVANE